MTCKRSEPLSPIWSLLALGVSALGLAAACARSAPPTRPSPSPSDCFAFLDEPDDIDCGAVEPISVEVEALERRRAVMECLVAVNHEAYKRKRDETLSVNRLTPVALPTVAFSSSFDDAAQQHPPDRLVAVKVNGGERIPNFEVIFARDVDGQLVQIELVPEVVRIREVSSCSCTGPGPNPGPPRFDFALLPAGQNVARKIIVKWPVQALNFLGPACS